MKKFLSFFMLIGILSASGCSCTKTGEYEFDSIIYTLAGEEKTFACTEVDKENVIVKNICNTYQNMSIELTKDGEIITKVDGDIKSRAWYKIEDGKFFIKLLENGSYDEKGTYEKGVITITVTGAKIVYKK